VFALPNHREARLLKRPHCIQVIDSMELWHRSDGDLDLAEVLILELLCHHFHVPADSVLDVLDCLELSSTLRPAPRHPWNRHREAFF